LNLHLKLSVLIGTISTIGMKNIKCVETYHSQYRNYFLEYKFVSKKILKYICCSKSAEEEFIRRFHPPKTKICAIPNGINREILKNVKHSDDQNKICFLSVGRLTEQKNFIVTVKAFSNFHTNKLEYKVIGEGPEKSIIENIILHSENEMLIDKIPREQIICELGKADMVVIPSLWEGLSIFMLEAMAMGCPLMISDIKSLRDPLEVNALGRQESWRVCKWGYLVSRNDIKAYREATQHYMNHQELKKDMRKTVTLLSCKYDIKNTAREYINVYKEIEKTFFKEVL